MADYHSVLSRAVGSLPENTAAGRRAIYDKARNALVRQLETIQPPLPPAEIAKQRLALEEAVRRIEGETARAALTVGRPTAPPRAKPPEPPAEPATAPPPRAEPTPPPRTEAAPRPEAARPPEPRVAAPRPETPPRPEPRAEAPRPEPPRQEPAQAEPARREPPRQEAARSEPTIRPEPPRSEPAAADVPWMPAETPPAPRAPRPAPNGPEARREPPALERRPVEPTEPHEEVPRPAAMPRSAPSIDPVVPPPAPEEPGEPLDALLAPVADDEPRQKPRKRRRLFGGGDADTEAPEADAGEAGADDADEAERGRKGRGRRHKPKPANDRADSPFDENGEWRPAGDVDVRPAVRRRIRRRRSLAPLIAAAAAAVVVIGVVAAAYAYRDAILAMIDSQLAEPAAPPAAEEPAEPAPKGSDRLPSATPPSPAPPAAQNGATQNGAATTDTNSRSVPTTRVVTPQPDGADGTATPGETTIPGGTAPVAPDGTAPGAAPPTDGAAAPPATDAPASAAASGMTGPSRSILYEEGEVAGTKGAALNGSSKWEMVSESIGGGTPEPIVRATIEVPERSVTTTIIIRRNRDEALPASHLIEVAFELPVNFPAGGITNLPGMIMKTTEGARGDALIGASARVSDGLFWIALSSSEADQKVNLGLLRDRGWIDLPILYNNGRRAILTIEKGSEGAKAINDAIDAWAKEG